MHVSHVHRCVCLRRAVLQQHDDVYLQVDGARMVSIESPEHALNDARGLCSQ